MKKYFSYFILFILVFISCHPKPVEIKDQKWIIEVNVDLDSVFEIKAQATLSISGEIFNANIVTEKIDNHDEELTISIDGKTKDGKLLQIEAQTFELRKSGETVKTVVITEATITISGRYMDGIGAMKVVDVGYVIPKEGTFSLSGIRK